MFAIGGRLDPITRMNLGLKVKKRSFDPVELKTALVLGMLSARMVKMLLESWAVWIAVSPGVLGGAREWKIAIPRN